MNDLQEEGIQKRQQQEEQEPLEQEPKADHSLQPPPQANSNTGCGTWGISAFSVLTDLQQTATAAAEEISRNMEDGDYDFNMSDVARDSAEDMSFDEVEGKITEVHIPAMVEVDTTKQFLTDTQFQNRDMVVEYAKKCGRMNAIVVVVRRSDINDPNRTPRIMLGCDRSGVYKENGGAKKRRSSTKKCGCPFSLKAHLADPLTGRWALVVLNGKHNHALVKSFEGHSYVGHLNSEENDVVETLSKTGVRSRDILNHIKLKDPTNASTMRTIYNVRSALWVKETADRSHMQQLFKLLNENDYVVRHRLRTDNDQVKELFFCCKASIQLARAFPFVFMLECTYKTNKNRLPLLQIVGVTSTMKTFCVAFCYMSAEKEENYEWALSCFRDLFDESRASVFISDRKLALMNALKTVFPRAKNLLCRVHITKNVLSNCVGYFKLKTDFDDFMAEWVNVMHSSTVPEFEKAWRKMQAMFKDYVEPLEYIIESWLRKYKTYFVSAWVDQYLHLGNTTTNRIEGSHSKLKKYLSTSVGGFVQSFNDIHLLLQGQVIDIKASFENSLTRVPIRYKTPMYKELINVVSITALEKIEYEFATCGSIGVTAKECVHKTLLSLGLPCAHMLTEYRDQGRSIPLGDLHNFWKKLCLSPYTEAPNDGVTIDTEIEIVRSTFANANAPQKLEIKRQLELLGLASSTTILEPKQKTNVRGRNQEEEMYTNRDPSTFEYAVESHMFDDVQPCQSSQFSAQSANKEPKAKAKPQAKGRPKLKVHRTRSANTANWVAQFPQFFQPYISTVTDVPGDGHCGFRVVASFYGWDIDGWKMVRRDLANELHMYRDLYDKVLAPLSSTSELLNSVDCYDEMADSKNWLIMPYMGNVISTCYNVVVLLISKEQCISFFPLRGQVSLEENQRIMVFGYINGSHFVRMDLEPDCPIPPISKMWSQHHHEEANGWPDKFASRIEKFKKLCYSNTAIVEVLD